MQRGRQGALGVEPVGLLGDEARGRVLQGDPQRDRGDGLGERGEPPERVGHRVDLAGRHAGLDEGAPDVPLEDADEAPGTRRGGREQRLPLVQDLVEAVGLRPLDVGPLKSARYLEGMAWLNIGLNAANGWTWTSAWHLHR